jgi:hypothetical protein
MVSVRRGSMVHGVSAEREHGAWSQCGEGAWCMVSVRRGGMVHGVSAEREHGAWCQCREGAWCMVSVQRVSALGTSTHGIQ